MKILGYDAAGIVDAVGPEVSLFNAGRRSLLCRLDPAPGAPNSEFHLVDERIVGPQAEEPFLRATRGHYR